MTRYSDNSGSEPFEYPENVFVKRATDKALLLDLGEDGGEIWIPKSVVHDDSEVYDASEHNAGKLVVFKWFARKQEWADD